MAHGIQNDLLFKVEFKREIPNYALDDTDDEGCLIVHERLGTTKDKVKPDPDDEAPEGLRMDDIDWESENHERE